MYIQEIFFGHWAYCHNLKKTGVYKQYEVNQFYFTFYVLLIFFFPIQVRARVNIDEEELIGEYTGRICYQKDIPTSSHYVANFW